MRRLVALDAGGGEIAKHLANHVLVARFLEIGANHILGIGFGLDVGEAHQVRRPCAEQAVAARDDPELHLLIAGIHILECLLAAVERGHGNPLALSSGER
jgi:hypothetical protein